MTSTAVVGLQWGDEGKGKIIDHLAAKADVVIRFAGGNNAGHTVIVGDEKYVLHLIPGGILHEGALNIIGRGLVVDLAALLEEMDGLIARGVPIADRLRIDGRAHVIFPYHRQLDAMSELCRGDAKIGTTGRGIGPAYSDKVARTGLRVVDLLHREHFEKRFRVALAEKQSLAEKVYGQELQDVDGLFEQMLEMVERIRPLVVDGGALAREAYAQGKSVLFEGAQGTMLDLDAGTYPFVTSSWTGVWGIAGGTGFPPNQLERALAVTKAYCTRVGEGPFPTELFDADGDMMAKVGHEFGATTGRPRRCGWFDAVQARYATQLNGLDGVYLTKLDVLSGFETIKMATAYRLGGETVTDFPAEAGVLGDLEPVYTEFPGWAEDITEVRCFADLPTNCQTYIRALEVELGVPAVQISVGPDRNQLFPGESSLVSAT